MNDLLIEFLSEEIPSRMQKKAREDLHLLLEKELTKAHLSFCQIQTFVTPRRLAAHISGLPEQQEAVSIERKGPRVDGPQAALDGFVASTGLPLDQCEQRQTPKGTFYFAVTHQTPQKTQELLETILTNILLSFPWPKSMVWGLGSSVRWVRPLHGILCLWNGKPLALHLPVPTLKHTLGHRILSPGPIIPPSGEAYASSLEKAFVLPDPEIRRQHIATALEEKARERGLLLCQDEGLLEEVTGLVEWPVPLMGTIDQDFMSLPREILLTIMRHHQRYFALETKDGKLAPFFITLANATFEDDGKRAIEGNEQVLKARLSDGRFFWQEDCQISLSQHAEGLSRLVFHNKLGSIAEKCMRIEKIALALNKGLKFSLEEHLITQTARLLKADLTTKTVIELPELQGKIGYHLASYEGLSPSLAKALREHYEPQGPSQPVPTEPLSILMSLADKLDTLTAFFLIQEKPTGSKDPFALRRAALGIIRIVLENALEHCDLSLTLRDVFKVYSLFDAETQEKAFTDLWSFFEDRLRVFLREAGIRHDIAAAAMEKDPLLLNIWHRAHALSHFFASEEKSSLLIQGFKRANNILTQSQEPSAPLETKLLKQREELDLFDKIQQIQKKLKTDLPEKGKISFDIALMTLCELTPSLEAFFTAVTVNVSDKALTLNRLALLEKSLALFSMIADFSRIEG